MELKAMVSNMNINSEGFMLSEKVAFPLDEEEIDSLFERLKIKEDETCAISGCVLVSNYPDIPLTEKLGSLEEANELGNDIYLIDDYDEEKFLAIMEVEGDIYTAVSDQDNYILHCGDWEDIAKEIVSCRYDIPEEIYDYIDWQRYGEYQLDDGYYFRKTEYGILELC